MLAIFNHTGRLIYDADTGISYHFAPAEEGEGEAGITLRFLFPNGRETSWHGDAARAAWEQLHYAAVLHQPRRAGAAELVLVDDRTLENYR